MKNTIHFIVTVVLAVLLIHQWRERKTESKTYSSNMEVLNDSITRYKNKEGLWVAERKSFQGEKKQLEELLENSRLKKAVKGFKKPQAAVRIVTETEIDTVFISYPETIDFDFEIPFIKETKHYSVRGIASNYGVNFYDVVIPNEQSIVVGKKKIGFLKYEYRAEVTNSNPLIQVTELSSFNFKESKKRFHVGPFIGVGLTGATFGVGVSYSLFSF